VGGGICAQCCGEEREVTLDCPYECEHLQESRRFEKPPTVDPESLPYADVEVTESFLNANAPLADATARMLFLAAADVPGVMDSDVRESLDAAIRTLRTSSSGLIYESRPANPLAAAVQAGFQRHLNELREQVARRSGVHSIRDGDILKLLVFWLRMERYYNNGRPRCRAFLDSLHRTIPEAPRGSSLSVG
jgi:hypothetical protein